MNLHVSKSNSGLKKNRTILEIIHQYGQAVRPVVSQRNPAKRSSACSTTKLRSLQFVLHFSRKTCKIMHSRCVQPHIHIPTLFPSYMRTPKSPPHPTPLGPKLTMQLLMAPGLYHCCSSVRPCHCLARHAQHEGDLPPCNSKKSTISLEKPIRCFITAMKGRKSP